MGSQNKSEELWDDYLWKRKNVSVTLPSSLFNQNFGICTGEVKFNSFKCYYKLSLNSFFVLPGALFLGLLFRQIWFYTDQMTQTSSGIFTEHLKSQTQSSDIDHCGLFYVNLRFQSSFAVPGSPGEWKQSKWLFHSTVSNDVVCWFYLIRLTGSGKILN